MYIDNNEGFELVGVVDPLSERLEEAFGKYSVPGYTTLDDLLSHEKDLDLLVIASPTHLHAEHAIAAMERGVDVFCDKPIAPTLAVADRMIEASKRTGRKLMTYQPHRITPEIAAAHHVIESDLLGPVYMIKRVWSNYVRRNDWQSLKQYGGGMLNNYGAHLIDQILHLTASRASRVAAHLRSIASLGDADDVVTLLLELDNGMICDIEINNATAFPIPPWYIFGQRGTAIFDAAEQAFKLRYFVESELHDLALNPGLAADGRRYDNLDRIPWREETVPLAQFQMIDYYDLVYDYFAAGEPPFVPLWETREVMRVIDEARQYAGWELEEIASS